MSVSPPPAASSGSNSTTPIDDPKRFHPTDLTAAPPTFALPTEQWHDVLSTPCAYPPPYFHNVMLNLIRNPNITSSYLFRAEIFYDSDTDHTAITDTSTPSFPYSQHMKPEYRPLPIQIPAPYKFDRVFVRRLIPRNPQLDQPLVQTCYILSSSEEAEDGEVSTEQNLVLYLPHAATPSDIPWYHPTVRGLGIRHRWHPSTNRGDITIHYRLFPDHTLTLPPQPTTPPQPSSSGDQAKPRDPSSPLRLHRTALALLRIIHKHGHGQLAGYTKRVHHDRLLPQKAFQDRYTALKTKYAKSLIANWREATDPGKHVFEDLGIAAFLLEWWGSRYWRRGVEEDERNPGNRTEWTGFVDVGCGNGLLVSLLIAEGWPGWGFDARARKSWDGFPAHVRACLREGVLVPPVYRSAMAELAPPQPHQQDGGFITAPFPPGTFLISNHADELTPWTPLLASLTRCPFLAIPCCTHDFTGARWRVPTHVVRRALEAQRAEEGVEGGEEPGQGGQEPRGQGKHKGKPQQQPSAYAALTAWLALLTRRVGYDVATEVLRIPSTRNVAVLGLPKEKGGQGEEGLEERIGEMGRIVLEEQRSAVAGGGSLEEMGREWVRRAVGLGAGAGAGGGGGKAH